MQHCRYIISFYVFVLQQKENVAVRMLFRNSSNKTNATCEISTAAFLLKSKLIHDVYRNRTNIANSTVPLFDEVLYNLDIIINAQCKIYVSIQF